MTKLSIDCPYNERMYFRRFLSSKPIINIVSNAQLDVE